MKYRKKPVIIEAVKYIKGMNELNILAFMKCGDPNNLECLPNSYIDVEFKRGLANNPLQIHTLEGTMSASNGDYIIKGVDGEFYPCKPDIFELTYDLVEE